jgi:hypothetical protein
MAISKATPELNSSLKKGFNGTQLSPEQLAQNKGPHMAAAATIIYAFAMIMAKCRFVSRIHAGQRALDDALLALSLVG